MCEFVVIQQILNVQKHQYVCLYFHISILSTKSHQCNSSDEQPETDSTPHVPSFHKVPSEAAMNAILACIILRDSVLELLLNLVPEELAVKGLQECPQGIT